MEPVDSGDRTSEILLFPKSSCSFILLSMHTLSCSLATIKGARAQQGDIITLLFTLLCSSKPLMLNAFKILLFLVKVVVYKVVVYSVVYSVVVP
jgi:hypothetical protein